MTHLVDIRIDNKIMFGWAKSIGLVSADLGYMVHSLLCAAHGELRLRPFRVFPDGDITRVLGYSQVDGKTLESERVAVAEPMVSNAIISEISKEMPSEWHIGTSYAFSAMVVPLYQISRTRKQADVFLRAPEGSDRSTVYIDWLTEKIRSAGAVKNAAVKMFRLEQVKRRSKANENGHRPLSSKFTIPVVEIEGTVTVADSEAFSKMISGGVGRHAAFGMGAVLLRPSKG